MDLSKSEGRGPQNSIVEVVRSTVRQGWKLVGLLIAINFVWITLALILRLPKPPGSLFWLSSSRTILEAVTEHAFAGFLVGAATLRIQRALIGAAFQPLIDIDHLTAFANLPVDPRVGHSLILMTVLLVVAWKTSAWSWGAWDLLAFVSSQFLTHFAVAPPGFPLLTPVTSQTFYFPFAYPALVGIAVALTSFIAKAKTESV